MRAVEYFENAAQAARDRDRARATLEELSYFGMLSGVSYDGIGGYGSGDVMAAVDSKLTSTAKLQKRIEDCSAVMDEALTLLYGADNRGGISKLMTPKHADIVCAHYLQLESWRHIAKELSCSEGWCRMLSGEVMAYVDKYGYAYIRAATTHQM